MRETFPIFNGATSNSNVNSDQWYRQYQYNVPQKGRYLVVFSQKMTNGDSNYDFSVGVSLNDTVLNSVSSGGGAYVNYIAPSVTAVVDAEVILPPHSYRNMGLYPPTRIEKPPHSYRKLQGWKIATINYITTPRPFERRAGLLMIK